MEQNELEQEQSQEIETTVEQDDTEAAAPEIPAELEGLSEETIKETMAELEQQSTAEAETKDDAGANAEPNSDNKSSIEPVLDRPKQKIPYERFKKEVDEKKSLKAEVDSLRAELAAMRENGATVTPPHPQQTAPQQVPQQAQPDNQGFMFTPEVVTAIKQEVKKQAMQMSGLTQEDVDNLEYMDEDDQRKQQWRYANKAAEAKVMGVIQQAQMERARQAQAFMQQHQRQVDSYNAFVNAEKQEADFEDVKQYAGTTFFETLSPDDQTLIRGAYERIERNTASPSEIALIKRFFQDAKASYHAGNKAQKQPNTAAVNRVKQANAHPRAENIEGSAAKTGGPSVASLERMLNEKNWEDIPKEYQDMLLGLS